jgi:hypothetical protein
LCAPFTRIMSASALFSRNLTKLGPFAHSERGKRKGDLLWTIAFSGAHVPKTKLESPRIRGLRLLQRRRITSQSRCAVDATCSIPRWIASASLARAGLRGPHPPPLCSDHRQSENRELETRSKTARALQPEYDGGRVHEHFCRRGSKRCARARAQFSAICSASPTMRLGLSPIAIPSALTEKSVHLQGR